MSLGKMPGIKGLVSGGSQGKRRFKSDLSVDMISPPMGDFRHTMHVGRGGDVFGDTSFLSNHGGKGEPGSPTSVTSISKTTGFFTRTLRHVRKNSGQPRRGSRDLSPPPPPISPIMKNAVSLPQLNVDASNGGLQRMLFPNSVSSPEDSLYTYGLQSGFVTLPRLSRLDRQLQDSDLLRGSLPDNGGYSLTRSDSLTSFNLDLGPSLMSEVLGLIDSPSYFQMSSQSLAEGDEDEEGRRRSSVSEGTLESPTMSSPNPSLGSASLRGTMNTRGCSISSEVAEQEDSRRSVKTPDASLGSPRRPEPAIEAERFQRAADVLSRHYGGGSFSKSSSPTLSSDHKVLYTAFPEEEEEIKV
ncbi:cdc42 effector protein 1-like [Aplochiton taeniatus]